MSTPFLVLLITGILLILPGIWIVFTKAVFTMKKRRLEAEKEAIELTLTRYYDILSQHIRAARRFVAYENAAFDELLRWRLSTNDRLSLQMNETYFVKMLEVEKNLEKFYETHPELFKKPVIQKLLDDYHLVHQAFIRHRRRLNGAIASYNAMMTSFPHNLIAKLFKLTTESFFKTEPHIPFDENIRQV